MQGVTLVNRFRAAQCSSMRRAKEQSDSLVLSSALQEGRNILGLCMYPIKDAMRVVDADSKAVGSHSEGAVRGPD